MKRQPPTIFLQLGLLLVAAAAVSPAAAGDVAPHRLRDGLWVEVQGSPRSERSLKAETIEVKLPNATRTAQLKGVVESVDARRGTVRLLGLALDVGTRAEIRDLTGRAMTLEALAPGTYVKVSWPPELSPRVQKLEVVEFDDEAEVEGWISKLDRSRGDDVHFTLNGLRISLASDAEVEARPEAEHLLVSVEEATRRGYDRSDDDWQPSGFEIPRLNLEVGGRVNSRVSSERDMDLDRIAEADRVDSDFATRLYGHWTPSRSFEVYVEGRWERTVDLDVDDPLVDEGTRIRSGPTYVALRPPGARWATFRVGRVDVEDDREWFYDQNLDGVRVELDGDVAHLDVGVYRTDLTPTERSRDRKYVVANVGISPGDYVAAETFFTRREDRRESSDSRTWLGFRLPITLDRFTMWNDVVFARGRFRERDVRSWARDNGFLIAFDELSELSFHAGYAFASGDPDRSDMIDREYRDSGLPDNTDNRNGLKSWNLYGELTDIELSNIHVFSVGAGIHLTRWLSLDVVHHRYRQDQLRDRFRSDLFIDPLGNDTNLGGETDVILGISNLPVDVEVNWMRFTPGRAFATRDAASRFTVMVEYRR